MSVFVRHAVSDAERTRSVAVAVEAKAEITAGSHVRYRGPNHDYYGLILEVVGVGRQMVYLKRPGTRPRYGYVLDALFREVLAVG